MVTQGSNSDLLHCRWILYYLNHQESPFSRQGSLISRYCPHSLACGNSVSPLTSVHKCAFFREILIDPSSNSFYPDLFSYMLSFSVLILKKQSWVFIVKTDIEDETPILWPPDTKSWHIWKDSFEEEEDNRGWDGWMASPTQWTWVWVDSGSWWWTGRPGMLWFMGSQSRTRLSNWTELNSFFHHWAWINLGMIISLKPECPTRLWTYWE